MVSHWFRIKWVICGHSKGTSARKELCLWSPKPSPHQAMKGTSCLWGPCCYRCPTQELESRVGRAQRIQGKGLREAKATPETKDPSLACTASLPPADVRGEARSWITKEAADPGGKKHGRRPVPKWWNFYSAGIGARVPVGTEPLLTAVSVRRQGVGLSSRAFALGPSPHTTKVNKRSRSRFLLFQL